MSDESFVGTFEILRLYGVKKIYVDRRVRVGAYFPGDTGWQLYTVAHDDGHDEMYEVDSLGQFLHEYMEMHR